MHSLIHTRQPLLKINDHKNRILSNVKQLYNKYLDTCKKKRWHDFKQFEIIEKNGDQEPKSTEKEETKTKKPGRMQKPLWVKLNKIDFDSLIQDV